jgi:mannose-6-phosphate isomerase-like protein (cupin superfamily)
MTQTKLNELKFGYAPPRGITSATQTKESSAPNSQVTQPGDGDVFNMTPGEQFIWKATAATTHNAFDFFEVSVQPNYPGSPEHAHDANDELFYVLEGEFRFKVGDEIVSAPVGAFAYVPKGTDHAWLNVNEGISRMLTLFIPGGMQGFFEATSPLVQADPPDVAALVEAAGRFGTRVVGPPLAPIEV